MGNCCALRSLEPESCFRNSRLSSLALLETVGFLCLREGRVDRGSHKELPSPKGFRRLSYVEPVGTANKKPQEF